MDATVRVEGIAELRRALRRVDPELLKELRGELKKAGQPVAADAKRRVRSSIKNRGRSSGRAAGSIRVTAGGNRLYIKGGKSSVPYFGWLDFGGTLGPKGGRRNTQTRERLRKGRYLYPAIDAQMPAVLRGVDRAARDATRKAFQ